MILITVLYGKKEGTKILMGELTKSVKRILAEYEVDDKTMLIAKTSRKKWNNNKTRYTLAELMKKSLASVTVFDTRDNVILMDMSTEINTSEITHVKSSTSTEGVNKPKRIVTLAGKMSVINEINQIGVFKDTISVIPTHGHAFVKVATLFEDAHVSSFDNFNKESIRIEVSELEDGKPPKCIYSNNTIPVKNGFVPMELEFGVEDEEENQ